MKRPLAFAILALLALGSDVHAQQLKRIAAGYSAVSAAATVTATARLPTLATSVARQ